MVTKRRVLIYALASNANFSYVILIIAQKSAIRLNLQGFTACIPLDFKIQADRKSECQGLERVNLAQISSACSLALAHGIWAGVGA